MLNADARIKGRLLRTLALGVRSKPVRTALAKLLRARLGIDALDALGVAAFGSLPCDVYPLRARSHRGRVDPSLDPPAPGALPAVRSYATLFRHGQLSPSELVQAVYRAAPSIRGALLYTDEPGALAAAADSTERLRRGEPRSLLEGVPIVVKEEVDVRGLPTRLGTSWIDERPAAADCVAVGRLRAAGAVVIGNSPMTEYGLSPLGVNVHRTMPRNVRDSTRLAGGSSTGPAVAVASGLVPLALGVDGGGSIRTPAALNGVFGLKPSYGRIPLAGHGLSCGTSVVHVGPIGAAAEDLAIFAQIAAGALPGDSASERQPPLLDGELLDAVRTPVGGLRIGVDEQEWAAADAGVARIAEQALRALVEHGAELVPVTLPLARHAAAIGYLTIGVEAFVGLEAARRQHLDALGLDVQILLSSLDTLAPDDYLKAQRLRTTLRRQCAELLESVDLIALPTTASVAPSVTDDEAAGGFIDSPALDAMCRFAFLANLTGLPAATAPVGEDRGLPVGLQLVGDAWDEATVLRALAGLERAGISRVTRAPTHARLHD